MANVTETKELLDRIEAEIAGVKRQYDLFFQGARRTEPADKRREVEETLRRMGQRKIVNSNDQFRFQGLQSRFYSLCNLWARMVRDLEEGRMKRDPSVAAAREASSPPESVDAGHIQTVIAQLAAARKECGLPAEEGYLAAIKDTLLARAQEIAAKSGGKKVEFRVSVEEGKPKVKAVLR